MFKMNQTSRRALYLVLISSGALGLLFGCSTVSSAPGAGKLAAEAGANGEAITAGRAILTSRCISCHSIQPVAKYSVEEWGRIVQRMGEKARLTEAEKSQLLAYLVAARGKPAGR